MALTKVTYSMIDGAVLNVKEMRHPLVELSGGYVLHQALRGHGRLLGLLRRKGINP